jgi:hypothetical protein
MIIENLRNTRVSSLLLLSAIGVMFWIATFMHSGISPLATDNYPMPLYSLLFFWVLNFPVFAKLSAFFLTLLLSFLLLRFNEKFYLIERRNYFIPFIFILLTAGLLPMQRIHPALVASIFFMLGIEKIFETHRGDEMPSNFFDSAFMLSIGSLFYFNQILLMTVLWAGMVILRPFRIKEWLITCIGLLLPYLLLFGYYLFIDQTSHFFQIIVNNINFNNPIVFLDLSHILFFGFVLFLIVISSYDMLKAFNQKKIRIRKYFKILFWFFFFSVCILIFNNAASVEMLVFIAIPTSFLLANFFTYLKNTKLADILILIFLSLLVYTQV